MSTRWLWLVAVMAVTPYLWPESDAVFQAVPPVSPRINLPHLASYKARLMEAHIIAERYSGVDGMLECSQLADEMLTEVEVVEQRVRADVATDDELDRLRQHIDSYIEAVTRLIHEIDNANK